MCPSTTTPVLEQTEAKAFHLALGTGMDCSRPTHRAVRAFGQNRSVSNAVGPKGPSQAWLVDETADMTIRACNVSGFRNQSVTLTIDGTP